MFFCEARKKAAFENGWRNGFKDSLKNMGDEINDRGGFQAMQMNFYALLCIGRSYKTEEAMRSIWEAKNRLNND